LPAYCGCSRQFDVVDVEDIDLGDAGLDQIEQVALLHALGVDRHVELVAGFEIDLAGRRIDDVFGDIGADQVVQRRLDGLEALLGELLGLANGDLLAASTTTSPVSASIRSVTALRPRKRSGENGMRQSSPSRS
jgi:hypothetical protein